jgi:predicted porin
MKKSLIALAVLGAFTGAASAQSSVTIFGKMDLGVGKPLFTEDKQVLDAAGSRIGFRGVEDLGGGLKAVFAIEHRLSPDTGTSTSGNFWNGFSTVGLVTQFGAFNLGRQYTPAFLMIQNQIDPFGGDTVAQLRSVSMLLTPGAVATSTVAKIRVGDSIRYDLSMGGFNLGASIAEGSATNGGGVAGAEDRPFSVAANYAAGPFWVGVGYENPADEDDKLWNVGGRYNFGFATLALGYSKGTTTAGGDIKGWIIGGTIPVGALDIKVGYAKNDLDGLGETKKAGLGAHYNLSKRTKVYADFAKIGGSAVAAFDHKTAYDLGIQHNF